jgi:hypothetical protein
MAADLFLGFRTKRQWIPPSDWCSKRTAPVEQVCSVCDCLSSPPDGWVDRWDFNRACCYETEAGALATVPPSAKDDFELFAYSLTGEKLDANGARVTVQPDDFLDVGLPPLPSKPTGGLPGFEPLGWDVVSHEGHLGFGHSPLSCNAMAEEVPVNRFCLIDNLDDALKVAQRFDREAPEPGPYFVVQVFRRRRP